jgi:hypothetical protein
MIYKTILFAFIFFIMNSAIFIIKPNMCVSQAQWQDNAIKVQNYIYSDQYISKVIVGSSLACRISTDKIPSFFNMALSGQSIYEGLNIIKNNKNLPKEIFIETNIIARPESEQFAQNLLFPPFFNARKYFPALKEGKQPIAVLGFYLKWGISVLDRKIRPVATSLTPDSIKANKILDDTENHLPFFDKVLQQQIEDLTNLDDTIGTKKQLCILKEYVNYFQSKGVRVVFFEMPINPKLNSLPEPTFFREAILYHFSPKKYNYIPQPNCNEYTTADGLHLKSKESDLYTHYFAQKAEHISWLKK